MKEFAYGYWKQGLNIIIVKNKKPLVSWDQWQNQRQKEKEFNDLPWDQADGFAVLCGTQTEHGFFCAVDYDVKNLPGEIITKGLEILKGFPITQMEKTPSGGLHYIYWSKEKPKTISAYHNVAALELLGTHKLCIMAPSKGYIRLNDNSPSHVENLEATLLKVLEQNGITVTSKQTETWFEREDLKGKRYKGKNPPCINVLFRGTQEGLRNEHGIRLASYLLNFRMYQPNSVLKIMKKWNKLNTPALSTIELENIVKSAIHGNYVYGCNDPILRELCNKEECPISKKLVVLTKEEREKSEKLLESPNLLQIVLEYGRKRLIGEDSALLQNFIELCSGQTRYPISGIISGFSGSGKNESLRAIKPLIPEEWLFEFTTSTPEAVKYIPEEFSGTLIIYEAVGMRSKTGTLGLRAVGEGESIETIYPMRDEATGKMTLGRAKTNARNFITTESGIDIQPDLYRRVLKQSMNHSKVLTKRVMAKEMREAALPESLKQILEKNVEKECTTKEFQNALRVQNWETEVVVFTPTNLMNLLEYASTKEQQVALRTQIKKVLYFIRVLALLHQKRRENVKIEDKQYIIANPEDYETGLKVLRTTIMETISRIGKRQQEVLDLFEKKGPILNKHEVAKQLHVSSRTAARALKTLAEHGYLRENKSVKPFNYEVADSDKKKVNKFAILTNISEYESFYRKELRNFLKHVLPPYHDSGTPKKIEMKSLGQSLNRGLLKKIGVPQPCPVGKVSSRQELNVSHETNKKPFTFGKMVSENSLKETKKGVTPNVILVENELSKKKKLIPCPFCANFGKQMFFNSQHDLDVHIQGLHCGYPIKQEVE